MIKVVYLTMPNNEIEEFRGVETVEVRDGCFIVTIPALGSGEGLEQFGVAAGEWKSFAATVEEE